MHLPGFGLEQSLDWPRIELAETDRQCRVTAELPGFDRSEVQVLLTDRVLTIRGEKRLDGSDPKPPPTAERFFGRFERQIHLPSPIQTENVNVTLKEGKLDVVMAKISSGPQRIAVDE